jgi:SagB-type dehydrogenase family enzyme
MITKKRQTFRNIITRVDNSIQNPRNIARLAAMLYQENSKLSKLEMMKQGEEIGKFSNPYILQRASQPYKCFPTSKIISFLDYKDTIPPDVNLFNTIQNRRSIRDYDDYSISINELYHILHYCYGITSSQAINGAKGTWSYRSVPSGGGLYPLEIYLYLNNSVLKKGIYHFRPDLNALEVIEEGDYLETMREIIVAEPFVNLPKACCLIFISSVSERMLIKYGERGYRFILQEVGFVCQNISLVCQAINLASCMVGSFVDNKVNDLIKADGTLETIQGVIIIGKGKNETVN